jgi:predicted metal-binding protein
MMRKIKVGILTCSNMTRVLDCPTGACIRDMYERKGAFGVYQDRDVQLVGTASCNGCPTRAASATILPKVEGLTFYGAQRIHLSYCMMVLCPFVKQYIKAIENHFPDLEVIQGSHEPHQTDEQFRKEVEEKLGERHKTIIP